jgi:hypothetical protein
LGKDLGFAECKVLQARRIEAMGIVFRLNVLGDRVGVVTHISPVPESLSIALAFIFCDDCPRNIDERSLYRISRMITY